MASTANRIGAVALRSTSRIRPRCAHLIRPQIRVQAFHISRARRADDEGRSDGDRSQPLPTAPSESAEPSGIANEFPAPRTRVSGAETSSSGSETQEPFKPKRTFDPSKPLTDEEKAEAQAFLDNPPEEYKQLLQNVKSQIDAHTSRLSREIKMREKPMEKDDFITPPIDNDLPEDPYEGDDVTSLAHMELDQHRQLRDYMRIISWEMPKLLKLAKPFEPPSSDRPLRFRYTTYMGESHPAENKVVLEFCTGDLPLKPAERLKLVKLVGRRYDPQTDLVKMSCESFSSQVQNKRYLGDLVGKLMQAAKGKGGTPEAKDSFADIPVDFRHVKWRHEPQFPEAWKMTPERQQLLQNQRAELASAEKLRIKEGSMVDGMQFVRESYQVRRPALAQERAGASLQGRVDKIKAGAKGKAKQTIRI